jgi:hypothetical protein
MFNEREAIRLEMEDLKEQSRKDFDFYFEMRKFRNERMTQLQNRLRDLDEIEYKRSIEPIKVVKIEKPFTPKNQDMKPTDLMIDRIESIESDKKSKVPYTELSNDITHYLMENGDKPLNEIKSYIQHIHNTQWRNFSSVMKKVMEMNPNIKADKTRKNYIYSYKK